MPRPRAPFMEIAKRLAGKPVPAFKDSELKKRQEAKEIEKRDQAARAAGVAWAKAVSINEVGDDLKDLDIKALRLWILDRLPDDPERPLLFLYGASDVLFYATKVWLQKREQKRLELVGYEADELFGAF